MFGAIASAIGLGASILGGVKSGKTAAKQAASQAAQAQDQAEAEADNLEFQAKQQRLQAVQERAISHLQMARVKVANDALLSTQRVGMAGSGFMSDDASNVRITKDTVRAATIDELLIKAQGEDSARQMLTNADILETSAANARKTGVNTSSSIAKSGANAQKASYWNAGATLISGAAGWLDKYGPTSRSGGAVGSHSMNMSLGHEMPAIARLR